jgi:hypothetical protein
MKIIGYMPDLDQTIEGVITDCTSFVPTEKGMQAAPSALNANVSALANTCFGAATVRKLDNSFRNIAGTATKLYELSGAAWVDVSRAAPYNVGADNYWRFTQFGDTTLAVNKADMLQFSVTGAFADVVGAPKAAIVETVGNQVFLFNTNETSLGDSPNRWWASALGTYDDWVPSIATQSVTGLLTSAPGPIFAGKRFGNQIIAYKERAMYIGTYVGAPVIWDFQQIQGEAGCSSQEAVVNIGNSDNPIHLFMGADDFWRFDGSRPVPIGAPVKKTVYAELLQSSANKIKTLHDRTNSRVYFFYPSNDGGGAVDRCVVYHYRENRWGRDDRTIEAAVEYLAGGITYDTLDTLYPTYDSLPTNISYDSPFWVSGDTSVGIFNTSHQLQSLNGMATTSSFTTGDVGNDAEFLLLQRVKPKWLVKPTSATMTNYYKDSEGDDLTTDQVTTMGLSRFDVLRSARWHRFRFDNVGDCTLNEAMVELVQDGEE